jgi:short subunit dehydrogenase-like uncharacterized protein
MVDANIVPTSGQIRYARTRTAAGLGQEAARLWNVAILIVGVVDLAASRSITPASAAVLTRTLTREAGGPAATESLAGWAQQITATAAARGQRRVATLVDTPQARQLTETVTRAALAASISLEHTADETHDLVEEQLARISNLPHALFERVRAHGRQDAEETFGRQRDAQAPETEGRG